jgi:hypothetical protein
MAEHQASVEVRAPVHQVYTMFTHFNDFPKFMHFIKEVTYSDDQHSHWVAQIAGQHEWDAINEGWIPDQQVGWRSTNGFPNQGRVTFQGLAPDRTLVSVFLSYEPPAGKLGDLAEALGVNTHFEKSLQQDMEHFARMVEQAPPGAEDPMASSYLFHEDSAVHTGHVTERQRASMSDDPMMSQQAMHEREQALAREAQAIQQAQSERDQLQERQLQQQQQAMQDMQVTLQRQVESERLLQQAAAGETQAPPPLPPSTLGGRGAEVPNRALGDMDARSQRYPDYERDDMRARHLAHLQEHEEESPWRTHQQAGEEE